MLFFGGVEAFVSGFCMAHLIHDQCAFQAGVFDDLADRRLDRLEDDVRANGLIRFEFQLLETLVDGHRTTKQSHSASRDDPFRDRGTGGVEGVLDAGFFLFQFHLAGGADIDHRHPARQFGEPLLKFLLVVLGARIVDLGADLIDPSLDIGGLAGPVDNGGVVLVDLDLLGAAQLIQPQILQFHPHFFRNDHAARQNGDILQHGFAPVAESGGLDRGSAQRAPYLVHHQRGQGFSIHILGDEQEGSAGLGDLLENVEDIPHIAHLLLGDDHAGILQHRFHTIRIGNEIGGKVAPVELHALDHFQGGFGAFGLLDGNHAILAHLVHGVGDNFADRLVGVG